MVKTLTDRYLAGLRFTGRRQRIADAKARGLLLRVDARRLTWYFTYRNHGPTQYLRLGEYPSIGLAEARTLARARRHALDVDGLDPAVEKRKPPVVEPPAFTFDDFVPVFLAFQRGRNIKDWENDASKIKRYLSPAWGPRPLRSLTRADVSDLLDTIESKGLTVGVNRMQALISRIFTVALDKQKIEAHPAARMIKRFKEEPRERVLTDDELRTLWTGLDDRPGDASDAVRLRLLLGQRGGEVAGMLWSEIDLEGAVWSMPGKRTKNTHPQAIGLPATALALLKRRAESVAADEPRVFPGLSLQGDEHKTLRAIHDGAYEWKDLRRTLSTRLAGLGFDNTTIDRVLNHADKTVTEKHYNRHRYVEEIRQALTAWDAELQRIIRNEPATRPRVLPMRSR